MGAGPGRLEGVGLDRLGIDAPLERHDAAGTEGIDVLEARILAEFPAHVARDVLIRPRLLDLRRRRATGKKKKTTEAQRHRDAEKKFF